jgi:hypothetical protein
MSAISYLSEATDWAKGLTEARSLETLRAVVAGWSPFVPEAEAVVNEMDARDFDIWRDGLAKERKGVFAGEDFAGRFGALMMPTALLRGELLAAQYKAPLGAILIRCHETGHLEELTQTGDANA